MLTCKQFLLSSDFFSGKNKTDNPTEPILLQAVFELRDIRLNCFRIKAREPSLHCYLTHRSKSKRVTFSKFINANLGKQNQPRIKYNTPI